jgi:Ala-tRNA(Pro) deacylase
MGSWKEAAMSIPQSIAEFLRTKPHTVVSHRMAFTAQEEAAAVHVRGREWAKTVACFADEQPVLAVLPAHHRVDLEKLRKLAGARSIRLANERELSPMYPGCETGAMPPLGPLFGQRVYVDRVIAEDSEVVFHGGTHVDAVRMRYSDLAALCSPTVGDFSRSPGRRLHH